MKASSLHTLLLLAAMAAAATATISCDTDFQTLPCQPAGGGGQIDPWQPGKDTTTRPPKDTASGFDITLDKWGDTIRHDIAI